MKICLIGTGLIGGSIVLKLRDKGLVSYVAGVDKNNKNLQDALSIGIIDEACTLSEALDKTDLVILAIPVDAALELMPTLMNSITHHVVMDVGSTKTAICQAADIHISRKRFVATHPMWGTEFNGPKAASSNAFTGKAAVICDKAVSDTDALETVENLYRNLDMHIVYMQPEAHDLHTAYVSHVSHITSFALANTVLEKEKEDDAIFELASAGFESTVRLAKSNPKMWVPIF
ncbi:MAG: prephenate dehydrogenase, partial [Ferruginibacter sp.]